MTNLSVRNVTCDYYLEKPNGFNKLRLRTNVKVPIIRMFGILETGINHYFIVFKFNEAK